MGRLLFRRGDSSYGEWRVVNDEELAEVAGRSGSGTIGARSEPFGRAVVEIERDGRVVSGAQTSERNHVWVQGLEPDTEYRYRVLVDDRPWAHGERWDWHVDRRTLLPTGRRYDNRFRTFPAPETDARVVFAALGDLGVGIFAERENGARQLHLARVLERSVERHGVRFVATLATTPPRAAGHRRGHRRRGRRLVSELLPALPVRAEPDSLLPHGAKP
jgi:tartrate-resistant acid phosphatase type 5